ncbi:protein PNS1 [Ricinus communis]|uniref:Choline transporter-like protein n=1 Tax=Ricinus communis TaxID=3988 RepID=B9RVI6_RICCO|nr:protein PNS1 [Ricinus communis]EEF44562.1 gd2b, putative [Ricinus communis]|eukprot:XP_002517755.1 protein PNS1 [Ricinus communis]
MGAAEPGLERESERREEQDQEHEEEEEEEQEEQEEEINERKERDLEKGEELGIKEKVIEDKNNVNNNNNSNNNNNGDHENDQRNNLHVSMLQRLNPSNPLRIVINNSTRVASPSPSQTSLPRSTPNPQPSITTLNSRRYTNKISLFLFVLHMILAIGLVGFLIFKGIQGLLEASDSVKRKEKRILKYFLPQVEAAALLSITLACVWQKAVRVWPRIMVHFILWCSFFMSLSAGILLICFQKASTDGVGVCLIAFAIGNGLYACWVNQRIKFSTKILIKSLEPVPKFGDLNEPTYWMLGLGFVWMSLWILAVVGASNFHYPPLIIIALVLSLAWVTEVMRNVVNLTVSRVISLYYLRGMQASTQFCFQRAVTRNLGSACLGSVFVPSIEALRIVARGLNLLEGEDEFMFSCAHCCLGVMNSIFKNGNSWAYVQIAAYGKGFVQASQDTWELFKRQNMEIIVDSDITSSICFLTGVCSGSICVILVAAWTHTVHEPFTATLSLLAFFIGYLMARIAMAVPHACVSCYYVCYAENPENRLFDTTIKDRQERIKSGHDVVVPTPRVPHRFAS